VGISVSWQLGKFLDKAIDIVPCHMIMARIVAAASHHNCVFVGNPAGTKSTVTQIKGSSTWHNLCSELCCTPAAKQHDGVGKRCWSPSHVRKSCRACCVQVRPAGASSCPRDAGFFFCWSRIPPTHNQPSPRQEGDAMADSWSR